MNTITDTEGSKILKSFHPLRTWLPRTFYWDDIGEIMAVTGRVISSFKCNQKPVEALEEVPNGLKERIANYLDKQDGEEEGIFTSSDYKKLYSLKDKKSTCLSILGTQVHVDALLVLMRTCYGYYKEKGDITISIHKDTRKDGEVFCSLHAYYKDWRGVTVGVKRPEQNLKLSDIELKVPAKKAKLEGALHPLSALSSVAIKIKGSPSDHDGMIYKSYKNQCYIASDHYTVAIIKDSNIPKGDQSMSCTYVGKEKDMKARVSERTEESLNRLIEDHDEVMTKKDTIVVSHKELSGRLKGVTQTELLGLYFDTERLKRLLTSCYRYYGKVNVSMSLHKRHENRMLVIEHKNWMGTIVGSIINE